MPATNMIKSHLNRFYGFNGSWCRATVVLRSPLHPEEGGDIAFVLDLLKADMGTSEENSAMRSSVFLNNLEQWMDGVISQNGLADKELIRTIKAWFERSIQANISHHEFMMNSAKDNNDGRKADRHRLMADVYKALI